MPVGLRPDSYAFIIDQFPVESDNVTQVASYRIDSVAQLARELSYTPVETSSLQVVSAEDLLHEIDSARAYPLDYVVFRITGYHPRIVAPDLLTGLALQHDLGLLIEQLSDRHQLVATKAGEPVLSIDDVAEQFNITSKTVQRWRRRGLPARRFIFADGKRRVGFLLSSVERFIRSNRQTVVDAGPNLARVEADEQQRMIEFARRLAIQGRCWPEEIARRIGGKMGRSPLTVLHTIRAFDQAHPEHSVLQFAAKPMSEQARSRILRRYRKGWSLSRLAARSGRPKSSVLRIILDQQIDSITRRKTRFIDDPLYHQPNAAASIQLMVAASSDTLKSTPSPEMCGPLHSLCASSLLSTARERSLFLQLNFYRFQFVQARRKLDPQFARWRQLRTMSDYLSKAAKIRNEIVCANLRLVISVARKHLRPVRATAERSSRTKSFESTQLLMDLVSDGSLTLMRAIDSFDVHRGNRFSTYATLSLMKGFAQCNAAQRNVEKAGMRMHTTAPALLQQLPDRCIDPWERFGNANEAGVLLNSLDKNEQRIMRLLFGIGVRSSRSASQIAVRLGTSASRVRQIEKIAIEKMRRFALSRR